MAVKYYVGAIESLEALESGEYSASEDSDLETMKIRPRIPKYLGNIA